MKIYRFKIYNKIGNVLNIGKMIGTRASVEDFCSRQIEEARKNTNSKWEFKIDLIQDTSRQRPRRKHEEN